MRVKLFDRISGLLLYDLITDIPSPSINALYSIWEVSDRTQSFTAFLRAKKVNNNVIDISELPSQNYKVG